VKEKRKIAAAVLEKLQEIPYNEFCEEKEA